MKKVLLTAALGCTLLAPAFAVGGNNTASNNGTLQMVVNDYITMNPSGGFTAGPITFSTPQEMVDGWSVSGTVTIVASRAWKYEYSASDFVRNNVGDPAGAGVALTVPAGNIWTVATGNGSPGVNTYNGTFIASSNTAVNMANQATGTLNSTFDLSGKLTPGLANQMSGTYNTVITQIASLD